MGSRFSVSFFSIVGMLGFVMSSLVHSAPNADYFVPVTFYDFHEDGSCPNIGASPFFWGSGAILNTLDTERKPVTSSSFSNGLYIEKFYRTWVSGTMLTNNRQADTMVNAIAGECVPNIFDDDTLGYSCDTTYDSTFIAAGSYTSDTLFKNVVVPSAIKFEFLPETEGETVKNFCVRYADPANSNSGWGGPDYRTFWPMDGKGWEALGYPRSRTIKDGANSDNTNHNYGFTMEFHNSFIYHGGEKVYLEGLDAQWLFINDTLRIDRGGAHHYTSDTLLLDSCKLTAGSTYRFDCFWAQIQRPGSAWFMKTDLDFVTRSATDIYSQTVNVQRPVTASSIQNTGINVRLLGRDILCAIPQNAHFVNITITNTAGRIVTRSKIMNALGRNQIVAYHGKLPVGIYVVGVECVNGKNVMLFRDNKKIAVIN